MPVTGLPMASSDSSCRFCGAAPAALASCSQTTYLLGARDSLYMRVRYGDEHPLRPVSESCPRCGTPPKGIHHAGCDVEECPLCRKPFVACRCAKD